MDSRVKNRKISLFLPTLAGGGAERVMVSLANGFADSDMHVDLVLAKAEGPYLKEISPKVQVVNLKTLHPFMALFKLVMYLRRMKPDFFLSTLTKANTLSLWAKIFSRSKGLFFVREASTLLISSKNAERLKERILPLMVRWFYRFADGIILPSEGAESEFSAYLPQCRNKTHVIYNPVITEHFLSLAREGFSNSIWDAGDPVILAVGRLTKAKDYPTLLKAFALVCKERKARLIILGEGEDRLQLEELGKSLGIGDDLFMPGFVDNPFVYMKHTSLYVLSSRWEGLPNTLIQATSLETPVVATNCPSGPAEILENGRWGSLVPVGDIQALAEAISEGLDFPKPSSNAASRTRFEVNEIIRQYLKLFEEIEALYIS